jgi:hypothetical protein
VEARADTRVLEVARVVNVYFLFDIMYCLDCKVWCQRCQKYHDCKKLYVESSLVLGDFVEILGTFGTFGT